VKKLVVTNNVVALTFHGLGKQIRKKLRGILIWGMILNLETLFLGLTLEKKRGEIRRVADFLDNSRLME
jgi:hypothetical protein